jgi:rubredoxin
MAMMVSFDEAKKNQFRVIGDGRHTTKGVSSTPFIGPRRDALDKPDVAQGYLSQRDPGRYSGTHFHAVDQFQVVLAGKGKRGKHDLVPYDVHFARAYTPYGPILADAEIGLTFFALRAHSDPGSQRLPDKLEKLKQIPNRQPWQISRLVTFPEIQSGTDAMLQAVPDIKDENGLAAYMLTMKPNARGYAPDPSSSEGQYLVVANGSVLHNNNEYKTWALGFVEPTEGSFEIQAGPDGLEAFVLNFPRVKPGAVRAKTPSIAAGFKKWQCTLCSFAYDEALGLPEDGIPAGTRWVDVPDTWKCPDCSSGKSDFQMVEV